MADKAGTPQKRPSYGGLIGLAVMSGLLGFVIWAVILITRPNVAEQEKMIMAFGTASLALAVGGVLGGFVAHIFKVIEFKRAEAAKERDLARDAHAAEQAFFRAILADLKTVYDCLEEARLLIDAHKSALTYGNQMRALPGADITLHNIRRALIPGHPELAQEIGPSLKRCSRYIKTLTGEFREHYKGISECQSVDEEVNKFRRNALAKGDLAAEALVVSRTAWKEIERLPHLRAFRDEAYFAHYYLYFRWHIDHASFHLRERLDGSSTVETAKQHTDLWARRKTDVARLRSVLVGSDLRETL